MKTKIIESNKYKRYNLYLVQWGGIYILITFIFITYAIMNSFSGESVKRVWIVIGTVITFWSVAFLPWILYYSIKMLLMRKNAESYNSYTGIITSIHTSEYFRSDYRIVDIKVEGVEKNFHTKIYKGKLYDEVARNIKIEIAYNSKNDDVIVLKVLE